MEQDSLHVGQFLWYAFIAYWIGVAIWIRGTDIQTSGGICTFLWKVIKICLWLCGGFIFFSVFVCAKDE